MNQVNFYNFLKLIFLKKNKNNCTDVLKLVRGHDNIVELLDLIDSDVGVAMVLQYARGGELFKEV